MIALITAGIILFMVGLIVGLITAFVKAESIMKHHEDKIRLAYYSEIKENRPEQIRLVLEDNGQLCLLIINGKTEHTHSRISRRTARFAVEQFLTAKVPLDREYLREYN